MIFGDLYLRLDVKFEKDDVAIDRGDIAALTRWAYRKKAVDLLKKLDDMGITLIYLPIAQMYAEKQENNKAEDYFQKAVANKEEGAAYTYALFCERVGKKDKAIALLKEISQKEDDKYCEFSIVRLQKNYNINVEMPENMAADMQRRKNSKWDVSPDHPFKDYPVRYIVWVSVMAVLAILMFYGSFVFTLLFGIVMFAFVSLRTIYSTPEWKNIEKDTYDRYKDRLGEEYVNDPDLGPADVSDVDLYPDKKDFMTYRKHPLFDYDEEVLKEDLYYSAYAVYAKKVEDMTIEIYLKRKEHLVLRFLQGEKELLPFLEFMYYLKFDGKKLISSINDAERNTLDLYCFTPFRVQKADMEFKNANIYYML